MFNRIPSAATPPTPDRCQAGLRLVRRLHGDQDGTISVLSVVTLLAFTMILGMVMNVGRQVDDKIKLQNAVDAATYSSSVVVARGMNAIAFTNHLLSEIFALTAYMREGRDRSSESFAPEILAAWKKIGPIFAASTFEKFAKLGAAITSKVPLEQELVTTFGNLTALKSQMTLPVLEYILGQPEQPPAGPGGGQQGGGGQQSGGQQGTGNPGGAAATHLVPEFQRAVVRAVPQVAQYTMTEIARRHAPAEFEGPRQTPISAVFWRTRVLPVGYPDENDPMQRTVPALDPANEGPDAQYLGLSGLGPYQAAATARRRELAKHYLDRWISDRDFDLGPFERETLGQGGKVSGKMAQFIQLWRIFTCGQLERLLTIEYPTTNLPHMLRNSQLGVQQTLENDYTFVGVVYWSPKPQMFPGMFKNPIRGNAVTFSQAIVFLPRPRYHTGGGCPTWYGPTYDYWSGQSSCGTPYRDAWPTEWTLFNQNWTAKPVPATAASIATILQTPPGNLAPNVQLPNLGGLSPNDLRYLNTH
jgi:hypothetical protein